MNKCEKLTEQLNVKTKEISRIGKLIDRLEKDKSNLRSEIQNITVNMQHVRTEMAEKTTENTSLYKTLSENEKEISLLKKHIERMQQQKGLVETQLFDCSKQIVNLNEKQQILQTSLERGAMRYMMRIIKDSYESYGSVCAHI